MLPIGVLVPVDPDRPAPPPEDRPVGRAALLLREQGIRLIFGDAAEGGALDGVEALPGRWVPTGPVAVRAVHDRFPSQRRAEAYRKALDGLAGVPMGNPVRLTLLCRDKLASQRYLEAWGVPMPEVVADPAAFAEALEAWGAGFLKPRFGALGAGVRKVLPGDSLDDTLEGVVPGVREPAILQRAVPPPPGLAGMAVRVLVQREADGGWFLHPPVLRRSATDPVANAARGAEVLPAAEALSEATLAEVRALAERVAGALARHTDGAWLLELGVDLVVDPRGQARVIEVNSRPRGRLEVLAERDPARFRTLHVEAAARPLRRLAALVGG